MAYYLKQISGIEPFTVDQVRFSQRRNPADEHPLYRLLTKQTVLQEPSVFQSLDGKFYNLGFGFDMVIFHPRLKYENGRPTFLKTDLMRKPKKINIKKLKLKSRNQTFTGNEHVLIQGFYADESVDAVPIDQIILYARKTIPILMLPKGNFRIRAIDKLGNVIGSYNERLR